MDLHDLVATSRDVASTRKRLEKTDRLASFLRRLSSEEVPVGVAYLSGELPQGRIGLGPAAVRAALHDARVGSPSLTLLEVDRTLSTIKAASGPGSNKERIRLFKELLDRATEAEQHMLSRLVIGELRQGALEGIMAEAIATATEIPAREVRRAVMLSGDLTEVARAAFLEGRGGLSRFQLEVFRPVQPMLAQTAEDVGDVFKRYSAAAFELKLDGARVQIHKQDDEVRVFTRRLHEVTRAVPEVVEVVRALPASSLILDGEVIALKEGGAPFPFQTTMRRFGRKLDVERMRAELPLSTFFFDCLHVDGETLIDEGADTRFGRLREISSDELVVPRIVVDRPEEGERFLREALERGHEGVMAKALDAPYEAGGRGFAWLKLKHAHTLDLVVLAVEWGSGRRKGFLSNLHLGARDPASGQFVMLGKTFKGMTDKMLAWQTKKLLELETSRDEWVVSVRPELVVEIAFNEIQESPQYPGGMALRFARVKRYREDKKPEEADTIDAVRAVFEGRG